MKRLLLAAALTLMTAGSAMAQTVVLVRHAEKVDASADPLLSEAGETRARVLANVLADADLDLVLTSPLQRTRMTAALSAAAHAKTPEAIGFDGGTPAHVAAVVARIRAVDDDDVVLVVGHSNTIPLIARALGYGAADMPDCEYDRLTVLVIEDEDEDQEGDEEEGEAEDVTAVIARYGAPSTC